MALPTCLIIFMHIVYLECTDISSNTAQRAASYRDLSTPSPTNASTSNPTEVPAVDESHSINAHLAQIYLIQQIILWIHLLK